MKCPKCQSDDIILYQEITGWQEFEKSIDGEWESTGEIQNIKETGNIEYTCDDCEHEWKENKTS
jgi:DNA-directed RNA polymerase subunit M/transcription elongation factor TFIIS